MKADPRILIVEDEGIVAFNLQQRLQQMGYEIAGVAESGHEALALAGDAEPDLVLMDIHIKGEMDGIEVASQLAATRQTPVIYLTAYAEDSTLERARRTRPYGYLIKPFSQRELHATIQMALERHAVQEALTHSQALLRQALDAAQMGTVESLADGRFQLSGPPRVMTGLPAEPVGRDGWLARVHPEDRPGLEAVLTSSGAEPLTLNVEFRVMPGEGDVRWLRLDATVRPDGAVRGVLQDIGPRKRSELRLRQLNEELEHRVRQRTAQLHDTVQELEAFSSMAAHDLRSPLRAIAGLSDILTDVHGGELSAEARDMIDRIGRSAQRMSQLVEALLGLARLSRQPLRRQTVDLSRVAQDIVAQMHEAEPHRHARCAVEPGIVVWGDPALLYSLLDNLLRNAWKFTVDRDPALITVDAAGPGHLRVRDNGPGFPPDQAERLFEPFVRLHSPQAFAGSGLGLHIVKRIALRHGGRVWAETAPEGGAVFHCSLPTAQEPDESPT